MMINSTIKLSTIAFFLSTVAGASYADNAIECAKSAVGENALVKMDEEQQRFFIQKTPATLETLDPLIGKIQGCLNHHDWQDTWSLSVFSEKKLAGYKDEPDIVPFQENDEWSNGYLAEYDATSKTLTLNPKTDPTIIKFSK